MHYRYQNKAICWTCAQNDPALYVIPPKKQQSKRMQNHIETIKQSTLIKTGDLIVLVGEDAGTVYTHHEAHDEDFNFPIRDACDDHDAICSSCGKRCCAHRAPDRMLTCFRCNYDEQGLSKSVELLRKNPQYIEAIQQITGINIADHMGSMQYIQFAKAIMRHTEKGGEFELYDHKKVMAHLRKITPKPPKTIKISQESQAENHNQPSLLWTSLLWK